MKAIIIAAGKSSRMGPFTKALPKSLAVKIGGKSLFDWQLKAFESIGVETVVVIRGYQGNKFKKKDQVQYVWNNDYENGNILDSLMCAESHLEGDVIVSYSDIWFESSIPDLLKSSCADIAVVVDLDWQSAYMNRSLHPLSEAEAVLYDDQKKVRKIGKIVMSEPQVHGEFIGMMRLSPQGCQIFREEYKKVKDQFDEKPFQRAQIFKKAYLTDMLQHLVDQNTDVHCELIRGGWREFDTLEDVERGTEYLQNGLLKV